MMTKEEILEGVNDLTEAEQREVYESVLCMLVRDGEHSVIAELDELAYRGLADEGEEPEPFTYPQLIETAIEFYEMKASLAGALTKSMRELGIEAIEFA